MTKRIAFCCALLCAASLAARADDNKPITNSGAQNLVFTFSGLSSMAAAPFMAPTAGGVNSGVSVPVYGIGYRYFIANDLALRGSLGLITSTRTTTDTALTDATFSQTGILISAAIEKHMKATNEISGYMGGLVGLLLGSEKNTSAQSKSATTAASYSSGSSTDINIGVYAGAEWFFNSVMSLQAEYQFGLTLSSSSRTNSSGTTSTTTDGTSSTFIGTNSVGVGLNVYISR